MPFNANAVGQHHIPRQRQRVTNWSDYDATLRQRGSLTVWFTEEAIAAWQAEPRTTRGGQPWYSLLAILTALTLRAVFRLALHQTEGLIGSILCLLGRSCGPGPLNPEPQSRDVGSSATTPGWRTDTSSGGQHGAEVVRRRRVADREARHQPAPVLAQTTSRDRC